MDQALDLVDQLATAIDAVHAAGLTHGDVRPQNVLLEPGGRAVLLDPSVACEYTLEQVAAWSAPPHESTGGFVLPEVGGRRRKQAATAYLTF